MNLLKRGNDFDERKVTVVDKDPNLVDALAVSPDKQQLVVSGKHSQWLYNYIIEPGGKLGDKQRLYWLHNVGNDDTSEVRSLPFNVNGSLYVASSIRVQICDENGRVRAILLLPGGPVTSLWFSEEYPGALYALSGGKLYKRKLKVTGAPSWQKAIVPRIAGSRVITAITYSSCGFIKTFLSC